LRGRRIHYFSAARNTNGGDNALRRNVALILQADAVQSFATDLDLLGAADIGHQDRRLTGRQHAWIAAAGNL
jgi:hypothetical protein